MDVEPPPGLRTSPLIVGEDRTAARWLQLNRAWPGLLQACADPPVFVAPAFLSAAECDALIAAGAPGLARSIVVDGEAGKSPAPSRTSESCYLLKADQAWLHGRVAALTGMQPGAHEPPQIARYSPSQFYLPHFDAFDVTTVPGAECIATGGQRVATVLIYLNDVATGEG